jgi:hypothetical protein
MKNANDGSNGPKASAGSSSRRRVQTTVGELIAAALEVTGGQVGRTLQLLDGGPLQHCMVRRLKFV